MKVFNKGFVKTMIIYGVVLMAVMALLIGLLALFAADYERTRPTTVAAKYVQSMDAPAISLASEGMTARLNTTLMSEESRCEYIKGVIAEARLLKAPKESDGDKLVYYMRSGGENVGRLVLSAGDRSLFGFTSYSVTEAEIDLGPLCGEKTFSLPSDWTAELEGSLIVTDEDAHYELLEDFYGFEGLELPHMITYSTGLYLVEPDITLRDASGQAVDEFAESDYTDNCTEEEKQRISEFAETFLLAYIKYSGNVDKNTSGNYARLASLIVPGSLLQVRMRYAVAGLGFASSRGDTLTRVDYKNFMDLGGGQYLCDLTYTVDTYGNKGLVSTENNLKLIVVEAENGSLLAYTMSSY